MKSVLTFKRLLYNFVILTNTTGMSHLRASHFLLGRITSTCSDQHRCQMWDVSATPRQTLPIPSSTLYCAVWYWWVSLIPLPLYSWGRNPQFSFSRNSGVPRASVGGKKKCPCCLSIRVLINVPLWRLPKAAYHHFIFCQNVIAIRCISLFYTISVTHYVIPIRPMKWECSYSITLS